MSIRVGTSGWQYADWRGAFYPPKLPQRAWLASYCESFDTVEVNSSFYRLPTIDTVKRWADVLPDGFVMAMKVSRYLTHVKRLREPAEPVARLMTTLAPLQERGLLGPLLIQLPPDFPAELARLDETLRAFPEGMRLAVEPRHASWFTEELRALLGVRGAALVWADRGGRSVGPLWQPTDWTYLRLHHGRDDWGYGSRDLRRWARRLATAGDGYAYANNDPGAAAVRDARRLREMVADRPQAAARE
ncbi:MAG TPA: DUF72 domain-containing protein [Mycobacteriales bacterium]|nr:DUF72 domain-containing protein [Mycobacteriales bacterium]